MKKIFTLIVMAVMAFSASAQNTYGIYMDETTLAGTLMGVTEEAIGYTPGVTTTGDVKVTYTNGKDTKYIAELEKTFGANFFFYNNFNDASFQYRPYIANGYVFATWSLMDGGVLVCTGYKNGKDETAAGFVGSDADAASRWPENENNDETQPKIDYFSKNLYEIAPDYWTGMTIEVPAGQALSVDEISVAIGGGYNFYWSVAIFNEAGELLYDSKVAQTQNNFNSTDAAKQSNICGFSADITAAGVSEPLAGYNFMPKSWHSSAGYFDNFIGEAALPITLEKADKMKAAGWDPTNGKSPVRKFQPLPVGLKLTGKNTVRVYFGCKNSRLFGLPYLYIKGSLEDNVKTENTLSTWEGKYTLKTGKITTFDATDLFPTVSELVVEYNEGWGMYIVTKFLGYDVVDINYGGIDFEPSATDPNVAYIKLQSAYGGGMYVKSAEGVFYKLVDANGGTESLELKSNGDGTFSLSPFFVVKGEYGKESDYVAGFDQNVLTKQEETKPVEWPGTYTLKSDNFQVFDGGSDFAAESELVVEYNEGWGIYLVTKFLGYDVVNINYGGIDFEPSATDPNVAHIKLKSALGNVYVKSAEGVFYKIVDANGGTESLELKSNGDGTFSLSPFFVVKGEYGNESTYVAGFDKNTVKVKEAEEEKIEWPGTYTLKSGNFQVFDGSSDFVAQSDMVIEYDAKYGEYYLTEFLGYDVVALNYGGIRFEPSTTDPNVAHISLGSIKTELPGTSYYKLVDGNGGSESLELKSYGNGTFLLSPFYVVKVRYDVDDTTYVAKYSQNIVTKKVYVNPDSSLEVTPDDPEGWNDLSRPHKLTIEGTYESPAGLDGMIEYAVEDSEEWLQLTEMLPSGSSFSDSLIAMFDATREKHVIRFRTRDNVGDTTLLPSIEYLDVSFHEYSGIVDKTYTGDSIYQDVYCADVEGMPIATGNYGGNVNAGTAIFYVEGVFPHTIGRKACSFKINPAQLTGSVELSTDSFVYNGQEHLPGWSFTNESHKTLEENKDYSVSYIDNIYPGTGKVRITGKGNYTSELEKTFFIDKAQLRNDLYSITLPAEDICYDENEHKAKATTENGVGEVKFTYTLQGGTDILGSAPVEAGRYDIYCEIKAGDLYYGKANEYIGSFAIYRFDESEWQSLGLLYAELQQMNVPLTWNMADGAKNVGTFDGLLIEEGHVVGVSLDNMGMTGLFPSSLMSFSKLEDINLSNNNLSGDIADAIAAIKTQNDGAFNNLKTLNISNNHYNGNIGILAGCMPNLTSLNASNNKFEDLFPALSESITELNISNQKMDRVVTMNMSDLSLEDIGNKVPTILLYDQMNHTYKKSINLLFTKADLATFDKYDNKEWAMQLQAVDNQIFIPYISAQNAYHGESGDTLNVLNMTGNDTNDGCSFRIALSFNQGDANFVNGVDATDLQTTILYAFGGYRNNPFNFTAANTFRDEFINVQDVICTVNILLESNNGISQNVEGRQNNRARMNAGAQTDTDAYMYIKNGKVFIHSRIPVASLSIKAGGNIKWDFERIGLMQSTANGNVVAYSLNGVTIPSYEDVVLGECTNATLYSVSLSDADAQPISVSYRDNYTTNIVNTSETTSKDMRIYDVSGYVKNTLETGVNIIHSNGTTKKIYKK